MLVHRQPIIRGSHALHGDANGYFVIEPPASIGIVRRSDSSIRSRVGPGPILVILAAAALVGFGATVVVDGVMRAGNPGADTFVATICTMVGASIAGAVIAFLLLRRVLPFYGENVFIGERGIARVKVTFGRGELEVLHYDKAVVPIHRTEHGYKNYRDEWIQWGTDQDCFRLRGPELIAAAEWAWQAAARAPTTAPSTAA